MKRLLALLAVFLVMLSSSSLGEPAYLPQFGHFAILIHDVSPGYLPQLQEITAIIDECNLQNETYLFVIPNHGGGEPIEHHPEFVAFLRNLSSEGYRIELHGYDHIGMEFDCDSRTASEKLELGLGEFRECSLPAPEYFIPPRYALSGEALDVLLSHNLTVIGEDFIYLPNGTAEPIINREYTWYLPHPLLDYQLESARTSYKNTKGTFFLPVHPKAVNSGARLEFLRGFLGFVSENKRSK